MAEVNIADVKTVRIHPAIGIARVGDSDEFFIGPEFPGVPPEPAGALETKFKDSQGRVKRQAARFRCFGYDDRGGFVELTGRNDVSIEWEVALANKKAAAPEFSGTGERNPGQRREDLTIAPGPRSITGQKGGRPPGPVAFDNGRVLFKKGADSHEIRNIYLGELRTDQDGCLLVLGGRGLSQCHPQAEKESLDAFNNDLWCDDVSDGPVKAKVTVKGRRTTIDAEPAWVIAAPPKFAPEADSSTTLWDQIMHSLGVPAPARPSYVRDIYPILQSARTIRAVNRFARNHHLWQHPVTDPDIRESIFNRLRDPGRQESGSDLETDMPKITGLGTGPYPSLTSRQYEIMKKWRQGDFDNDWNPEWGTGTPPPPQNGEPTPADLDRAALHACVGAAFFPGIEGGRFLGEKKNWQQPSGRLRLADHVKPGDVTAQMAVPWQADFYACGDFWWPVPRPNQAVPEGEGSYFDWIRDVNTSGEMITKWKKLGFVLRTNGQYLEIGHDLPAATRAELTRLAFPVKAVVTGPEPLWTDPGRLAAELADAALLSFGQATATAGDTQSWPLWLTEIDGGLRVEIRSADLDRLVISVAPPLGPSLTPDSFGVVTSRPDGRRLVLQVQLPFHVQYDRYVREGLWHVRVAAEQEVTYQLAATADSLLTFPAVTTAAHDGSISARVEFTGTPIHHGEAVVRPMSSQEELQEVALRSEAAPQATRVAGRVGIQQAQYLRIQVTGTSPMGHPFVRERLLRTDELP